MKHTQLVLIAVFALFFSTSNAYAERALSKPLIESFYQASNKLDNLEKKYPAILQKVDEFSPTDSSAMINYMKTSRAYPDIKSALSSSGFSSLEDFVELSVRIMGSMFSVQMQSMPKGMTIESMHTGMEQTIQTMKQSGAPADVIADMEKQLKQQKADMKHMQIAAKNASQKDKKFVTENMEWLMSKMPEEEL